MNVLYHYALPTIAVGIICWRLIGWFIRRLFRDVPFSDEEQEKILNAHTRLNVIAKLIFYTIPMLAIIVVASLRWSLLRGTRGKPSTIEGAPLLFRLSGMFSYLCSQKTWKRVFEPVFSDAEVEYFEAIKADKPRKARWVCIRTYLHLFETVCLGTVAKLIRRIVDIWKLTK